MKFFLTVVFPIRRNASFHSKALQLAFRGNDQAVMWLVKLAYVAVMTIVTRQLKPLPMFFGMDRNDAQLDEQREQIGQLDQRLVQQDEQIGTLAREQQEALRRDEEARARAEQERLKREEREERDRVEREADKKKRAAEVARERRNTAANLEYQKSLEALKKPRTQN
jgi:hypothetical protein